MNRVEAFSFVAFKVLYVCVAEVMLRPFLVLGVRLPSSRHILVAYCCPHSPKRYNR